MLIRDIEDDDIAAVIDLWHAAGVSRPWNDPSRDIAFARRDAHATILVAIKAEEGVVDIKYVLSQNLLQDVKTERAEVSSLAVTARKRSPEQVECPSLLIFQHQENYNPHEQQQQQAA